MSGSLDSTTILFSDIYEVDPKNLDEYGAYNISLVADLPLFIDPFLLFNSDKPEYKQLHDEIIKYLRFLRDKSIEGNVNKGLLKSWYLFKEVKQNWFGFTNGGNGGSGLGWDFANALNESFGRLLDFGSEKITHGTHLEKLCLIKDRVGRDNISDFTTNLIKDYLLRYTEIFSQKYINSKFCQNFRVPKSKFNYETESWSEKNYFLPRFKNDYILLTPSDLLTRDETWINRDDLTKQFITIPSSIPDEALRSSINEYFARVVPFNPTKKEKTEAIRKTIDEFPQIIDYFIKYKEDNGDKAETISSQKVNDSKKLFLDQFTYLAKLLSQTPFYTLSPDTYQDAIERAHFLKHIIEDNDGYRLFYLPSGDPIKKEEDLKIAYKLTWFKPEVDVNFEVNNGRGPADCVVSHGSKDKTVVEFKLASNSQLKKNLKNQVEIYARSNNTDKMIKIILYFSQEELKKVTEILNELDIANNKNIILIDASKKVSASKVN